MTPPSPRLVDQWEAEEGEAGFESGPRLLTAWMALHYASRPTLTAFLSDEERHKVS